MNYILLITSIFSMVLHNSLLSRMSKKYLHSRSDIYYYNSLLYVVCTVLFAFLSLKSSFSLYTVLLGVVFGAVTMLSNFYRTLALSEGPTHITILVTTSSMIIPTLSGVVLFDEQFSLSRLLAVFVLIFFIYLSSKNDGDKGFGKKWLVYCALAFIFQGIIGVIQKVHQSSQHKNELFAFLLVSFAVSCVITRALSGNRKNEQKFGRRHYIFGLISGLCVFAMNYLNLRLSGVLPSQLFFPAVNGTTIIFTSIVAVILFRERITKRQIIGIVGGLLSLAAICVL